MTKLHETNKQIEQLANEHKDLKFTEIIEILRARESDETN
jgi:hypothetical protein